MAVRQKAGRWTVEFQQGGARIFRRLPPLSTKQQAIALETKLRREITDQVVLGHKPTVELAGAIQLWLESTLPVRKDQSVRSKAALLAPFVEGKTLDQIAEAAQEATSHGTRTSLSTATINRRLCVLKATAKYAWRQGWIAENLSPRIQMLREENKREVYLTTIQVSHLSAAAPTPQCRAAIMLLAYTGLRPSELLALKQTDLSADAVQVLRSKTGRPRVVPVHSSVRPYLSALPLGLSYDQLHGEFLVARRKAKMPTVILYDLRHTCASWLINRGVDLYTVGRILGHSSPLTTARYAHLADKTLKAAIRKIA